MDRWGDQVLDDGYEKQEQIKWREAEVVDNAPASADDSESSRYGARLVAWLLAVLARGFCVRRDVFVQLVFSCSLGCWAT